MLKNLTVAATGRVVAFDICSSGGDAVVSQAFTHLVHNAIDAMRGVPANDRVLTLHRYGGTLSMQSAPGDTRFTVRLHPARAEAS